MCGRFAFQATADDLAKYFSVAVSGDLPASYNLAPTQPVPVIRIDRHGQRMLSWVRWGLIPFWAKDQRSAARTINARTEGIADKPTYREPFRRRRCLVLASGFYEWRQTTAGKTPYFITRADALPMAFAGLWDRWREPDGNKLDSCAIVTTVANEAVAEIHNRMPVILQHQAQSLWLEPEAQVTSLEQCLAENLPPPLSNWPVSSRVNDPANDGPELLEPSVGLFHDGV